MTSRWREARASRTTMTRHLRLTLWTVFAGIVVISMTTIAASDRDDDDDDDRDGSPYAIGLWGDLPYSSVQETGVANLITDMNRQRLAFTVHDGDLKQGNGDPVCNFAMYSKALGFFNSLNAPAMFTPGDNDWTDCDRPLNGGFDSLDRLSFERQFFFSDEFSLGQHRLHQRVQTDPLCLGGSNAAPSFEACVENRRWTVGRVTYATLNIQGSCNNLCGVAFNTDEHAARNAADIAWMNETFDRALPRPRDAYAFVDVDGGATDRTTTALRAAYATDQVVKVETRDGFAEAKSAWLSKMLNVIYALLALSVIVSLFGIVNTLALAVFERTREIGMLRAVGMSRRQARRMIRHEAMMTSLLGAALGLPVGLALAALATKGLGSYGLRLSVPLTSLVTFVVLSLIVGVLAAVLPARRAGKLNVLAALSYE